MRRWFRQGSAAAGQVGHHGLRLIGTLTLVVMLLLGAAAWRLSRGPVDLPFLATRIGAAATRALPGMVVTIGEVGLAWEGFRHGGAPIDLHLSDISVLGRSGAVAARISRLRITLSPLRLLEGRIAPIRIVARHTGVDIRPATLAPAHPAAAGTPPPNVDPAGVARAAGRLIAALARPPHQGGLDLGSLRHIRIDHAALSLDAPQAGLVLDASDADLDVTRDAAGHLHGTASAAFRHGDTVAPVKIVITGGDGLGEVTARIGPVDPARLAPGQASLARADLPVTVIARWPVGREAQARFALDVKAGPGQVRLGGSTIAVTSIEAGLTATPRRLTLDHGLVALGQTSARVTGMLDLTGPGNGMLDATVDRLTASALPADWPLALAKGARKYVVGHVTAGTARNGRFHAAFVLDGADHRPRLTAFTGTFAAKGVTLDWFKAATPMTELAGTLDFTDINDLVIDATSGRIGGLALKGTMTITDLTHHDQGSRIVATLAGDAAAAVPLLDAPPLRLASHGVALAGTTGRLTASVDASVPLIKHLTLKQVTIAAAVDLTALHLPLPIPGQGAGLALEDGNVAISASTHRFSLNGGGRFAGEPAKFDAAMTLPRGPLRVDARTDIGASVLTRLGATAIDWRHGLAPVTARFRETGGAGNLALTADFTPVGLAIPALAWRKAAGTAGHASITVSLHNGGSPSVRAIDIGAPDLALRGTGSGGAMSIESARLGGTRATGKLTPPVVAGAPWTLALAGPTLDLSSLLNAQRPGQPASKPKAAPAARPAGPRWRLRAAFDSLRLNPAPSPALGPVHIAAAGVAGSMIVLDATARTNLATDAVLHVANTGTGASVTLRSGDAGALFAALGTTSDISGGGLGLTATTGNGTTKGRAELTDFRLRRAPVIAKVLQGLSIYGVPAATSGPGLAITRLVAPFSITGTTIRLGNGRAYSASLGFTATGSIDTGRKMYDLSGTIVPAYAINTLPGRIPVIGKLFSPEKGSGVFAARYSVVGPFAKPDITVNPLAALTPGFLREIFGVFNPARAQSK